MTPATLTRLAQLTDAEAECLRLAWHGLGNREIGGVLGRDPTTVKRYLTAAYARLGLAGHPARRTRAAVLLFRYEHPAMGDETPALCNEGATR